MKESIEVNYALLTVMSMKEIVYSVLHFADDDVHCMHPAYPTQNEHWNCLTGNVAEASETRGDAHNYGILRAHRYYLELPCPA